MKRIETPLQASTLLDAFNCPITLTGNLKLQTQSPQWLQNIYFCLTSPSTLFAFFLSVHRFHGYNHLIKKNSGISMCGCKPIEDHKNYCLN
jgi:hypothetical protein